MYVFNFLKFLTFFSLLQISEGIVFKDLSNLLWLGTVAHIYEHIFCNFGP
jgi:hypothetical protein